MEATIDKIIINKEVLRLDGYFNLLGLKNRVCKSCKKKITINNFGLVKKSIGIFCNNIFCIMQYHDLESYAKA